MLLSKLKSSAGFTLVELMVTIVVMGIIFGTGIAAYINFNKTQTVKQAGLKLKNDLRSVQGKALSGERITGVTCTGVLDGYRFDYNTSGTSYSYYSSCSGPSDSRLSGTISLPTGVTFSNSGTVFFKVLGQGVNAPATLCLSGFSKIYRLRVTLSGEIQDDGIVTSCP